MVFGVFGLLSSPSDQTDENESAASASVSSSLSQIEHIEKEKQELVVAQEKVKEEKQAISDQLESTTMELVRTVPPYDLDGLFDEVKNMQAFRLQKFLSEAEQKMELVTKKLIETAKKSDEATRDELKKMKQMIEEIHQTSIMSTSKDEVVALRNEVKALRNDIEQNKNHTSQQLDIALTRRTLAGDLQNLETQKHTSELLSEMIKSSHDVAALKAEICGLRRELRVGKPNSKTFGTGSVITGPKSDSRNGDDVQKADAQALDDITKMQATINELKEFSEKIRTNKDIKAIAPELKAFREKLSERQDVFRKAELVRLKTYRELRVKKAKELEREEEEEAVRKQEQEQEPPGPAFKTSPSPTLKSSASQTHVMTEEEEAPPPIPYQEKHNEAMFQSVKSRVMAYTKQRPETEATKAVSFAHPKNVKEEVERRSMNKFKEELERRSIVNSFKAEVERRAAATAGTTHLLSPEALSKDEWSTIDGSAAKDCPSTVAGSSNDLSTENGSSAGPHDDNREEHGDDAEREGVDDDNEDRDTPSFDLAATVSCPRLRAPRRQPVVSFQRTEEDGDEAVKSKSENFTKIQPPKKLKSNPLKRLGRSFEVRRLVATFSAAKLEEVSSQ